METDLQRVLKQKIPYHAYVYPKYKPVMSINPDSGLIELFKEHVKMEMDDYNKYGRPLAEIKRALTSGTEEHKDCDELDVYCHTSLCCLMNTVEERIRINGWGIKHFKIFHVWNVKVNGKLGFFPWSAKFQPLTKEIEVEIHSEEENKNEFSKVIINTEDCDRSLTATVDGCEVNYSVFSDALRVELEIRLYEKGGSPVLNFSGNIHALFLLGKTKRDITIFDGEYKNEESEAVVRSTLILPRRIWYFAIKMALVGNDGKFENVQRVMIFPRSVPIDEQHYLLCQCGYMLITTKWGCCCVDKGLCTCRGTAACGIETFEANYPSSEESSEEEDSKGSGEESEEEEREGSGKDSEDEEDRRKKRGRQR